MSLGLQPDLSARKISGDNICNMFANRTRGSTQITPL